jgi:hypothetical protein
LDSLKLNSRERTDVYQQLFRLNSSFARITRILNALAQKPIFKANGLRELQGLAQEVQLEINTVLLNPLELAEMNDWTRFGKVRKAMEKKLKRKK